MAKFDIYVPNSADPDDPRMVYFTSIEAQDQDEAEEIASGLDLPVDYSTEVLKLQPQYNY